MRLRAAPFSPSDSIQILALVKWECDPELFHLTSPVK